MAEAILNREGAGKFQAFASSVDPHPNCTRMLARF